MREIESAEDGCARGSGGVQGKLAEIAIVLQVATEVADIADVDRGFSAELALDVDGPRIGRGNLPTRIDRRHIYRRDRAARRQSRIHSIEIASVKSRRVYQGRVAPATQVADILLDALV